jgi:hypothetical protein
MSRFSQSFNWKESKAHVLLLSKFIRAQEASYFEEHGYWEKVLNESPQIAIKRFINGGMLASVDLSTVVSHKYKVSELKALLKQRRLVASGTKDELVQRLVQADKRGMMELTAGMDLLICTQAGREISEQYIAAEKEKRVKVEQQVVEYLAKQMFKEASLAVANYETEQVFPRGMGVDWKHHDPQGDIRELTAIYKNKPRILSKLDDAKLPYLRIAAAMMSLWGENTAAKWIPPNFETGLSMDNDTAARMLLFNAYNLGALEGYKDSGVVHYVEIKAALNSCESCKKLHAQRYKLNEAPELPNPSCTYDLGCRCVYLPCVD